MQEITKEQAARITDLESFKEVTGAKRFKRTKDEMERGLSPEKALAERLKDVLEGTSQTEGYAREVRRQAARSYRSRASREIVIRIVPAEGVEWDPEWTMPITSDQGEIVVQEDEKFYGWVDTKLTGPYAERDDPGGDLIRHIVDLGLGEVIVNLQFAKDIEDYER